MDGVVGALAIGNVIAPDNFLDVYIPDVIKLKLKYIML